MHFLPSRGRPQNIERLIAAWKETGATTPLRLRLDYCDDRLDEYLAIELPDRWSRDIGERQKLCEYYNAFYRSFPNLAWYGFIADDVVPETKGWDLELVRTAGKTGMAVPSGGETTGDCPHFVIAGSLVREQGWLCLPGLSRLYIDTVWEKLAEAKGALRRRPDVVLKHHHFSAGLALPDRTYRKPAKSEDRALYEAWSKTRKETE